LGEHLEELRSVEDLDRALKESNVRTVLLFKHSLTCPISARAFRELQSYLEDADSRISYKLITVQTARDVSDEASSKLDVTHQSPQAILVRAGQPVWHASHSEITARALASAIRNIA